MFFTRYPYDFASGEAHFLGNKTLCFKIGRTAYVPLARSSIVQAKIAVVIPSLQLEAGEPFMTVVVSSCLDPLGKRLVYSYCVGKAVC